MPIPLDSTAVLKAFSLGESKTMDLGVLRDRVAIVTGSSQGIGKAIALGLSEECAKVIICAGMRPCLSNPPEIFGLSKTLAIELRRKTKYS